MSKVFITKNGQFLSRGEGVLTQIENPDLEVNDIGVEVSEKIAEDVKEGDLLTKRMADFDTSYQLAPGGRSSYKTTLFELPDGSLHSVYALNDGSPGFYEYIDGEWQRNINFAVDEGTVGQIRPVSYYSGECAAVLPDGRAIILVRGGNANDNLKITNFLVVYENGRWRPFSNYLDLSSIIQNGGLGMGQGQGQYGSVDIKYWNGQVHLLETYYPYNNYDYSTSSDGAFNTYVIDVSSETITQVHNPFNDASSFMASSSNATWQSCRFEQVGDKLCALLFRTEIPRAVVLYYDEPNNRWLQLDENDWNAGARYSGTLYDSSGNTWWVGCGVGSVVPGRIRLAKFNHSTSSFDTVVESVEDLSSAAGFPEYGGSMGGGVSLYEHNNNIYVMFTKQITNKFDEHYGSVLKYDGVSSLEVIPSSLMGFRNYDIGSRTSNYTYYSPTIQKHEGEIHAVITTFYSESHVFLKADETGERFTRNCFWATPPVVGERNTTFHTVSGVTLAAGFGNGFDESKIHEFVTSGDPSGYFLPFCGYDINPQGGDAGFFYEHNGNTILFGTNRWSAGNTIFQYQIDLSGRQAYKLEAPSAMPSTQVHTMGYADHSGVRYVAMGVYNNSNPIETYYLDGSTVVKLPDLSTVPVNFAENYRMVDIASNGTDLIMVAIKQYNSNDNYGFYTYKFNGSGWDDVDSPDFNLLYDGSSTYQGRTAFGSTVGVNTFVQDGEIYAIALYARHPQVRLYKYVDGSGFVEQIKMFSYYAGGNQDFRKIFHNGEWWFMHNNVVFKLDSDLNFRNFPVAKTGVQISFKSDPQSMYSVNGDLYIFRGYYGPRLKLSPYNGEFVWYNNVVKSSKSGRDPIAYGIALQDGSKGDIIKIRRIRR